MAIPSTQEREQKQPVYGGRAVFEVQARAGAEAPQAAAPAARPQAAAAQPQSQPEPAAQDAGRALDDEWRRWIAENLLIGNSPESLVEAMKASGFPEPLAAREVRMALESPYLRGCELLRSRLRKRDWVLSIYRKLNRMHPQGAEVERRHRPSRDEFLRDYYSTNRPVIITGMMDDWPAMKKWDIDFLSRTFGDREVEVQMNRNAGDAGNQYEMNHAKFTGRVLFRDFVERLRTAGETNDLYLTANNNSSNRQVLPELWDDMVQIPEYLNPGQPGGFFWMGPAGTVTPFHHDLTNNFMAQVMGRKLVKIAPSWDTPLMRNHLHCFSQVDGRVTPPSPHAEFDQPQILECILHPGEILFLPIGCWHYVQGLDITITVSFTNFVFDNDFSSHYNCYSPV